MKKQRNRIKPYKTTPYKEGCSDQVEYETYDVYGDKYKFYVITTRCDYTDKKGKRHIGYVLRVKWIEDWEFVIKLIPEEVWERVESIREKARIARGEE